MFGSFCQGLGFVIRTSLIQKLYFLRNPSSSSSLILPSIRFISSNAGTNLHSFTVSYLIKTCGFTPEFALSVSKHAHFETPGKPDSVLRFFNDHGFSDAQILEVTRKIPSLLLMDPSKTFVPKLQFLQSKGASKPDVVKIISSNPGILRCSLENQLVPAFNFFRSLLQSNENTMGAIKRYARMLALDLNMMVSNLSVLRDNGVPEKNISFVARNLVRSISVSPERFMKAVEEVRAMGFDPSKTQFVLAIKVRSLLSNCTWEKKLDAYRRWGLSEEEILAAFRRAPFFMSLSEDRIMAVMDLFVNKLGWEASRIAKRPLLTMFSMEKRLTPRASVWQFLVSEGLLEKEFRNPDFFTFSEAKFLQRYISPYHSSPQIVKICREKLDPSG